MINKKKSLIIAFTFMFLATVTALSVQKTEFVITTDPYENFSISIVDPDANNEQIGLFEGRARKFGEYRFTYYGTVDKVKLKVRIVNNQTGETIEEKEFGPYTMGTALVALNYSRSKKAEEVKPVTTTTANATTSNENVPVTGNVVESSSSGFSKVYYIIGGVVLAVILVIFVMKRRMSMTGSSNPSEPNPKRFSKVKVEKSEKEEVVVKGPVQSDKQANISDTEKKIADLQKQLDEVRSEEKLMKLQRQLNTEKQSLRRMQDNSYQQSQNNQNQNRNQQNQQNRSQNQNQNRNQNQQNRNQQNQNNNREDTEDSVDDLI